MAECDTDDEKAAFTMALQLEVQQLKRLTNDQERAVNELGDDPTKGHSIVYDAGLLLSLIHI